MNASCPQCGYQFYREPGYFLGAMVLSYFASSALGISLLITLFAGYQVEIIPAAIASVITVAILNPFLYRVSRIFWIQMDYRADPEKPL